MVYINSFSIILLVILVIVLICVNRQEFVEKFSISSAVDQDSGASSLYNWGYRPIPDKKPSKHNHKHHKDPKHKKHPKHHTCKDADITKNKDIDLYVLKTSVPPCKDLNKYIKKSEIPPNIDIKDYILKSSVPSCPNMKNYIKKTEIPACTKRKSDCEECPICPTGEDMSKFVSIHYVNKHYIKKNEIKEYCEKIIKKHDSYPKKGNPQHPPNRSFFSKLFTPKLNNNKNDNDVNNYSSPDLLENPMDVDGNALINQSSCPNYSALSNAKHDPKGYAPGLFNT
tara:strand:+ start:3018 stop:3866 length:849 start_codon:yes stop_codon:yes gene_type:complete